MGTFIATQTVKELIKSGVCVKGSVVTVLGFTFKENVPDIRNTRVIDIVRELLEYGLYVQIFAPMCDIHEIKEEYDVDLVATEDALKPAHAVLYAVPHQYFMEKDWSYMANLLVLIVQ
jgi:UDP-N-acetyl-D-galactosamine dehydrogenase